MDPIVECQEEIRRLRTVISEMEENCIEFPFKQGSKVFGVAAYCNLEKIIYLPEQCYYVAPYNGEHVIQGLMGGFKVVKDVFATKAEAEKYIEENGLN
ncbi:MULTISPECIES: hypothetical protein [Clostridium]|jgi:hypothetical protein|uniref:hypothetical protein n=1 Tax=Clostridium TaxID=1485 RepID=UPI000E97D28C|nr:hypothetical protein [Clostridium tyrobutyricum]HBF77171.1 hypothetical protein [Clostridiaceae bacterium]